VFEGGGFGVGVTVTPTDVVPYPSQIPTGVQERPTRLGELLPVAARTPVEKARELQRVQQAEAVLAAYKLELVAGLAADRPRSLDRAAGSPGAASADWVPGIGGGASGEVSEFFADELAMVLTCSRSEATRLSDAALLLVGVHSRAASGGLAGGLLTATWSALADGELDWPRARAIAAELRDPATETDPAVLVDVESAVLAEARRLSVPRVRAAVRRELARHDAAASDRRRLRAAGGADVTVHPLPDGMAELRAFLPYPQATAMGRAVDEYARLAKSAGDQRPIGVLRAEVLHDLVTRPWDARRPPVTAHVTVLAPLPTLEAAAAGHDACAVALAPGSGHPTGHGQSSVLPAEVEGEPITAAHLREVLERLDSLGPGGLQPPAGGQLDVALTDPRTGALRAVVTKAELARLAGRGCGCPVAAAPPPVHRYRHTPAQKRFVSARDRSCSHPGCRDRVGRTDLDHVTPHATGGPTDCANLCCLCRRHHRLKTHAPGWSFTMTAEGVLTVTTPSGVTRVTRPPGPQQQDGAIPEGMAADPPPF
jgi:hypothetical protein